MNDFNPGEVLMLTSGEYSDYSVNGVFVVQKGFNKREIINEFVKETKPFDEDMDLFYVDERDFVAWIHKKGLVTDINYTEWRCISYGSFDMESVDNG